MAKFIVTDVNDMGIEVRSTFGVAFFHGPPRQLREALLQSMDPGATLPSDLVRVTRLLAEAASERNEAIRERNDVELELAYVMNEARDAKAYAADFDRCAAQLQAAEARVKAMEAESRMAQSGLVDAEAVRAAMGESMERMRASARHAGERITQLESDLATARTVQVHALVADVVEKAREWRAACASSPHDQEEAGVDLLDAVDATAGITIQPVRTLSKQEADVVERIEVGGHHETANYVNALLDEADKLEAQCPVTTAAELISKALRTLNNSILIERVRR